MKLVVRRRDVEQRGPVVRAPRQRLLISPEGPGKFVPLHVHVALDVVGSEHIRIGPEDDVHLSCCRIESASDQVPLGLLDQICQLDLVLGIRGRTGATHGGTSTDIAQRGKPLT
jgi:hypothetical protein